jgi:hypothetical protein
VSYYIWPISKEESKKHDSYLVECCLEFNLNVEIMRAIKIAESQKNPNAHEFKKDENGKYIFDENGQRIVISRGYYGICRGTVEDYHNFQNLVLPKDLRAAAYNPYLNTRMACWAIRRYLNYFNGDYKAAASSHNMGLEGFKKYRRKTGNLYRWQYIYWVRKCGAKGL